MTDNGQPNTVQPEQWRVYIRHAEEEEYVVEAAAAQGSGVVVDMGVDGRGAYSNIRFASEDDAKDFTSRHVNNFKYVSVPFRV